MVLELVHFYLCGMMQAKSFNKNEYFVIFIDSFSHVKFVYFLKNKSNVFEKFQIFKTAVKNQIGKILKILQSDNGGEYISQRFQWYCVKYDITK